MQSDADKLWLFRAKDGTAITRADLLRGFEAVRAQDAKSLFIHTDLCFGAPNPAIPKRELLQILLDTIRSLGVPTLLFPTFTFSFCNGQSYDVAKSRSKMGVLNEFVRTVPGAVRSRDPLMSVVATGADTSLVTDIGKHSIGEGCTFDLLHNRGGGRFLFVGARPSQCLTFVHYIEERAKVPYRYDRPFTGDVTDAAGVTTREDYALFVRYKGVIPSARGEFEDLLLERGICARTQVGDGPIYSAEERPVFDAGMEILSKNIDFLLAEPHPRGVSDTTFEVKDMVAL